MLAEHDPVTASTATGERRFGTVVAVEQVADDPKHAGPLIVIEHEKVRFEPPTSGTWVLVDFGTSDLEWFHLDAVTAGYAQ